MYCAAKTRKLPIDQCNRFYVSSIAALMRVKIQKRQKNVSKNPFSVHESIRFVGGENGIARTVIDSPTDSATVFHHDFLIFHFRFRIWQRPKHHQVFNRVSKLYRRFMTLAMNGVRTQIQSHRDDVVVSASVVHSRCKRMTIGRQRS